MHCGLFGHVDSGKTAIAAVLSQVVSTAGLDAHPQAKKRGISIDLGFTSFNLDEFKIALVDAPGHADLIRSVVASANIIDLAILVIDATKGPEMQTGEHMVILESLGIEQVLVAMNKIDLIDGQPEDKAQEVRRFLKQSGTVFANAPIVPVSAKNEAGFDFLLDELRKMLASVNISRDLDSPFLMPFDHHFQVKGFGTIMTGTILSGKVKIGDMVQINPLKMMGKVKSIHIFKESYKTASAGDRVGIAVSGIDNSKLYRGCMLSKPDTVLTTTHLQVEIRLNRFFKHPINFHSQVHATSGMLTVPGYIYPYEIIEGGKRLFLPSITKKSNIGKPIKAYLHLLEPLPCRLGFPLILSRLDLSPQELRIAAHGEISLVLDGPPPFFKIKTKIGKVKNGPKGIIENLAYSIEGAKRITGKDVRIIEFRNGKENIHEGMILEPFGTKGNVRVEIKGYVLQEDDEVLLEYPKPKNLPEKY